MPSRVIRGPASNGALPIGTGGGYPGLGQTVGSVGTAVFKHRFPCPAFAVQLEFYNGSADPLPMRAGIRYETYNATVQCTLGGVEDVTVPPKSFVLTDPIHLLVDDAGIRSLTYVNPASGDVWAANAGWAADPPTGEGSNYGGAGTDLTASGPAGLTASGYAFAPSAVYAVPAAGYSPSVIGLIGDSIVARKDNFITVPLNVYPEDSGFSEAGFVNVAVGGEAGGDVLLATYRPRYAMLRAATHIVNEYGVNSVGGLGFSLAQMQAENIAIWQEFDARGQKVAQTSVLGGLNAASAPQKEAVRVAWNDWLRDGAPMIGSAAVGVGTGGADRCPVYDADANLVDAGSGRHPLRIGYIETADVIETGRNSGEAIDGMLDETGHPVSAAHTAMSAAVPFPALGVQVA